MANAATDQMIKMAPLFLLAIGIATFFTLVQKDPQKASLGCGGFFTLAIVLGIFGWFLDFIAKHAFLFIFLALTIVFVSLVAYMIYSPPSLQKPKDEQEKSFDELIAARKKDN